MSPKSTGIASINARTYSRAARKRLYIKEYWLAAEASLLMDNSADFRSRRILELGAGSGRLSSVLYHRAVEYVATDVNPEMISTLRAVHPQIRAEVADARDLRNFNPESFDTVIFAFNGIDSLDFSQRPRVLMAVSRVLKTGGAFIHSTHNLVHARAASQRPAHSDTREPIFQYFLRLWNRFQLARFESYRSDHAVVNDRALQNGLLNVYTKSEIHFSQLDAAAFSIESIYDRQGRKYSSDIIPDDQWYYLVARKAHIAK